MIIYISLYVIIFYLLLCELLLKANNKNIYSGDISTSVKMNSFHFIIIMLLIVVSGFRYYVGTDYLLYELLYEQIDQTNWINTLLSSQQELGYTLLSLMIKSIFESQQAIFFCMSIFTVLTVYFACRKLSPHVTYSLLMYVGFAQYFVSFNLMRQSLAVALIYLALGFFVQKKNFLSIICITIAISFHNSAIVAITIFLLIALIKRARISPWKILLLIVPISFVLKIIIELPLIINYISLFNAKYGDYLYESDSAGLGTYLIVSVYVLLACWFSLSLNQNSKMDSVLLWIFIISIPLTLLGTSVIEISRLGLYFSFSAIIIIPRILGYTQNILTHTFAILLSFVFMVFHVLSYNGILPYQDYFEIFPHREMNIHIPK